VLPTVSRLNRRREAALVRPRLTARAIWANELRGLTFRVGPGSSGTEFIKVADADDDFAGEAERPRWAAAYVTVPRVLGWGLDGGRAWLRTRALPGLSAVHPRWLAEPDVAVRAIGAGLRLLHDRMPVPSCPFEWLVPGRLARLAPSARARLGPPPPIDRTVVCHGDACAPNTLVGDDGRCCGHVDFGGLGVADRWADLSVATLSLGWNYPGRGWDAEFFGAYGVEPDPERLDYYRRLWRAEDAASR
jgi:kanamycin kinase